jgi:hypothetical protein
LDRLKLGATIAEEERGLAMITGDIRRFIEEKKFAIVASSDSAGKPHLALGSEIQVLDDNHLVFENWFCRTTIANVARNPQVSVAVMAQDSEIGYQFIGTVADRYDSAILDGYVPGAEPPGEPQILIRFVVRVEEILAFCAGIHTDNPLSDS